MLEADHVRTAQTRVEAAQKRAIHAKKLLERGALSLEKREALMEAVALAETLAATTPTPHAGPIFVPETGTALNMNNLLNRQILPALGRCQHCHNLDEDDTGGDHKFKGDESLPS